MTQAGCLINLASGPGEWRDLGVTGLRQKPESGAKPASILGMAGAEGFKPPTSVME
jgi:hypothetical protein